MATPTTHDNKTRTRTLLKIVVTGPFNAGKTQFVSTISDIDVVTTERIITTEDSGIKSETTVAMDYGRVEIDNAILHLHGTPGQWRFDFMWEILTEEMNGFIVLIDSTDPVSFADARSLITLFSDISDVPYLVAAGKQDLEGALHINEVRSRTAPGPDVLVMPCIATSKTSIQQVLRQMIELING